MKYLYFILLNLLLKMASALECGVIPIELWSGSPSLRTEWLTKPINLVVIQHTVTTECMTDEDCIASLKSIRTTQISMGYEDIAISFLIGGNGKVYEGAGWRVGAGVRGYNNRSISISFMGDFRYKLPTPTALNATQALLACGMHIKNLGFGYKLVGHQQLTPTLSPGAKLQSLIQTWPHWTDAIISVTIESLCNELGEYSLRILRLALG